MSISEQFLDERLRGLPRRIEPSEDLWPRIERRISAKRFLPRLRAVAAALAIGLGATLSLWVGTSLESDQLVDEEGTASPLPHGGLVYANAVDLQYSGALKLLASQIEDPAYSQEAAQLQLGLRTLQHATEEIRAALAEDPDALYLAGLLENTHRKRIEMLRDLALAGAGAENLWRT